MNRDEIIERKEKALERKITREYQRASRGVLFLRKEKP